jgi:ligand-binding sensor protein
MHLTDLMPLEDWMKLESDIHAKFGVDSNVFDKQGIRISKVKNWTNRLCPAIKATDKGQSFICAVAHMNLAAMAEKQKGPVIEECDAGFVKMVVPIFRDDVMLGAVGACGVLLEDGEVDTFMVNRTTDLEEAHIEELAHDAPMIAHSKAEAIVAYIQQQLLHLNER